MKWDHRKLTEDLAFNKGTCFIEVPLGSVWGGIFQNQEDGRKIFMEERDYKKVVEKQKELKSNVPQRADVIAVKPSYTRFCLSIYEVKVNRSDFLNDIRSEKWRGYLDSCHRFYFATPSGLVKKDEIPAEAGWIVRGDKGWTSPKRAVARDIDVPKDTLLSMLFYRRKESYIYRDRLWYTYWPDRRKQMKLLGKKIGKALDYYDRFEIFLKRDDGSIFNRLRWKMLSIVRELDIVEVNNENMHRLFLLYEKIVDDMIDGLTPYQYKRREENGG